MKRFLIILILLLPNCSFDNKTGIWKNNEQTDIVVEDRRFKDFKTLSSEKKTSQNKRLQINLALNYGSKNEIINALNEIKKKKANVNEVNISNNLFTKNIPDPDLLIRTGNTKRLSNFLLWQLAYSEIYFEKKLWPDFNENDYNKILNNFKKVKRNYGNI